VVFCFTEDLQRRERAGQTSTKQVDPSPMMAEKARSQLEESRKLNSEGLEVRPHLWFSSNQEEKAFEPCQSLSYDYMRHLDCDATYL